MKKQEKVQRLWIVDNAVAYVDNGLVTLQIDEPVRHLPRNEAFQVADKIWFANQMRELEIARRKHETKVIPLTDRRRRSSLRLGGGFMITQGQKLVIGQRDLSGSRPGQFCEFGGLFEPLKIEDDHDNISRDFVASLLKESQELALVMNTKTLLIPQLAPSPLAQIGFQPPGPLNAYNSIIEEELKSESDSAKIAGGTIKNEQRFWIKLLDYEQAVTLEFSYSHPLSVEVVAEIDTSSLECVGVLSYPDDIDSAVKSYLEENIMGLEKRLRDKENSDDRKALREYIKTKEEYLKQRGKKPKIQYWDCELHDHKVKNKALDRDIHIVDTRNGEDEVWFIVEDENGRRRESRQSDIWTELAKTKLGPAGTGGRFATEKLEKAIKMHCPTRLLQPLITL